MRKFILAALFLGLSGLGQGTASAQGIILNSGSGDIFFLYESQESTWHTVFRAKGTVGQPTTTGATGLTSPFSGFTGTVGSPPLSSPDVIVPAVAGDTGDYSFDSLTVNLNTTATQAVGGTDFFYTHTSGEFQNTGVPDLGIRIRLREDQVALETGSSTNTNQFDNFTFTLNTALSTFNGTSLQDTTAHVSLFGRDGDDPVVLFNSAGVDQLTGSFNNVATHQHRNWGFSQYGDYAVVLDVQGVGGDFGDSNHQATINFNVIPEPSTLALVLVGLGFGGWLRKQHLAKMG